MKIRATVMRGKNTGILLMPHIYKDGMYVVSKTRFECDYIRVPSLDAVATHIADGYSVRMSNPEEGVVAPSLIRHADISVTG